jgi:exo-beta-1,3-glucanase (GH17 family)
MKNFAWLPLVLATLFLMTGCDPGPNSNDGGITLNPPNKPSLNVGLFVLPGQNPDQGTILGVSQVDGLLDKLKSYSIQSVRFFTAATLDKSTESLPSRAQAKGFNDITVTSWLTADPTANARENNSLISEIQKGNVDLAGVGSEVLHRGNLTSAQLLVYINQVKLVAAAKGVPVTTDDTYEMILAHPEIVAACDKIMINIYPYWEGVNIDSAFTTFLAHYNAVKTKYPGKEIIIGETGWPSAGNTVGQAVPNPANALKYAEQVLNWSNATGVKCYYFEAFDEPWKEANEGPQGAHWGLWDSAGVLKPGVLNIFNQTPSFNGPVTPTISIANASFAEGNTTNTVQIPVKLSTTTTNTVTVNYATSNGSAIAGTDYLAGSGQLTFAPGVVTQNISLQIIGDYVYSTNKTLQISLSDNLNGNLGTAQATITMTNDDTQLNFTYTPIPGVPQAVNDLGQLICQKQRDEVTPGGTVYYPNYSDYDQLIFETTGQLALIVNAVKADPRFALGVASIRTLGAGTQATVYAAFAKPLYPTWAMNGYIGDDGTTNAGYAVEGQIATGLTNAVKAAL